MTAAAFAAPGAIGAASASLPLFASDAAMGLAAAAFAWTVKTNRDLAAMLEQAAAQV